jgi:DegV family protein with EDD domain
LNISVIPLWLLWDGESYQDGIDIFPTEYYQRLVKSKTLPTTSQPSAQEFVDFYQKVLSDADAIVSVLVSSQISGTIASAEAAAAEHPEFGVRIVDSNSSAMGLGLAVLAAARAAKEGKSIGDVVAAAENMRDRVNTIFVVDTLEYLHKGGRISGGKRLLGSALNIKPILHFEEGQIRPLSQARTKRKALNQLLDIVEERLAGKPMQETAIMDVDTPGEGDMVADMVKERFEPARVHRTTVSPVVGTHVGPGTVGIAFYAKE